jgi:DNA-3-methyladenine glycosylase
MASPPKRIQTAARRRNTSRHRTGAAAALDRPAGAGERSRLVALLSRSPAEAARALLGQILVRRPDAPGEPARAARIVETEAYLGADDPAAHASRGRTARTEPLWGPPGSLYVYFIYGMHHCLNLAVQPEGVPGCVLVRAAEPLPGQDLAAGACRGPGRLCRALALDRRDSGASVFDPGARLWLRAGAPPARVGVSPRVGIRHAAHWPLRFFDADSPAVSRAARSRE